MKCFLILLICSFMGDLVSGCEEKSSIVTIERQIEQYRKKNMRKYYNLENTLIIENDAEINDIKQRLNQLKEFIRRNNITEINFLLIFSFKHAVIITHEKIYFILFEPIVYKGGRDARCSLKILDFACWSIDRNVKDLISAFKNERRKINDSTKENFSPLIHEGRITSWEYTYLFIAWKDGEAYECLFAFDPCQPGMEGKSYYFQLLHAIHQLTLQWKQQYLMKHKMIPEKQLKFLKNHVYLE